MIVTSLIRSPSYKLWLDLLLVSRLLNPSDFTTLILDANTLQGPLDSNHYATAFIRDNMLATFCICICIRTSGRHGPCLTLSHIQPIACDVLTCDLTTDC